MDPRPTFLDRRPLGIPNYLAIALVAVLVVASIPRGARRALDTNTNKVEDWLPDSYSESADLAWFRSQFGNEAFVVISWDGCTLGDTERLGLLAQKLAAERLTPEIAKIAKVTPHSDRRVFERVISGPSMIDRLTGQPARLERDEAIERLTGALVGPPAVEGDDATRATCLMAYLGPHAMVNNRSMRLAIERIVEIAAIDCGIDADTLHLCGPPVDNVAIDIEGEKTLRTLAALSGLVGLVLAYACFRSVRLTGIVLVVAGLSAGASLAMVFYFGAFEVLVMGAPAPRLGKLDAILMSMPAVVYVLSLSGAIHLVNYYRDAVQVGGRRGAVERAVRMALVPCALASLTTAIGLASLATSDILPIEKFGVFSAIGVIAALALLFSIVPVALHRFAPSTATSDSAQSSGNLPGWARRISEGICIHYRWVLVGGGTLMVLFALGLPRIVSSVDLIKLLHPEADLVQDYKWLEAHLGNLVPMEVVVAVPAELRRGVDDHPEASGQRYAMTTYERLTLARRVSQQLEALEPVSRALNAGTFAPADIETRSPSNRRTHDYIVSEAIDENRPDFREFLRFEQTSDAGQPRELWRASARVAALDDIDYGQFVTELKDAVEPVLAAYRARNQLVVMLSTQGRQLAGARIAFVVLRDFTSQDALFAELLREAGVATVVNQRRGKLWTVPADLLKEPTDQVLARIRDQDLVVTLSPGVASQLAEQQIECVALQGESTGDADLSATFTGVVPLVYKTQRQLLVSLQHSLVVAAGLITIVLVVLLRSLGAGLATMIPNLFPIVVVFGALGWLGISVDIGIMMTASVALGVAVDDTVHFVSWFRRGLSVGLSRYEAAIESYERCATAMVQTTVIAGLGLAVFAFSTFTPTQQFGYLMVTILAAALVGDLILLPALLVSPLGRLFPASQKLSQEVAVAIGNPEVELAPAAEPAADTRVAATSPPTPVEPAPASNAHSVDPTQSAAESTSMPPVQSRTDNPVHSVDPEHGQLTPANAALRDRLRALRRSAD